MSTGKRPTARRSVVNGRQWLLIFTGLALVVGIVAGLVWSGVVSLPQYTLADNYLATISQQGLTQIAATDVIFSLLGIPCGIVLGVTAWLLFKSSGWMTTLIASVGALLSGLLAMAIGQFIGPRGFDDRIASAGPGTSVPIDLTLHTHTPLALWVACGVIPVVIGAAISREHDKWISLSSPSETGSGGETSTG